MGKERKLYTNTITKPYGQVPYYRCAAKKSDGNLTCEGGNWGAEHVERLVWLFVKELLTHPEVVMTAVDATIEQEAETRPSEDSLKHFSDIVRNTEQERLNYVKLYASGKGIIRNESELSEYARSCDERISGARAEIEKLTRRDDKLENLKNRKQEMRNFYKSRGLFALENVTEEHKQRIYEFLNLKVYLYKDTAMKGKRKGKADVVRVKGRIVEGIWGEEGCTFKEAMEIAAMYNFTKRMSLACGMIPNEEYHYLAR